MLPRVKRSGRETISDVDDYEATPFSTKLISTLLASGMRCREINTVFTASRKSLGKDCHHTLRDKAQIDRIKVSTYKIPTDFPESDGMLQWDSTTLVLVEASGGGNTGLGGRQSTVDSGGLKRGTAFLARLLHPSSP